MFTVQPALYRASTLRIPRKGLSSDAQSDEEGEAAETRIEGLPNDTRDLVTDIRLLGTRTCQSAYHGGVRVRSKPRASVSFSEGYRLRGFRGPESYLCEFIAFGFSTLSDHGIRAGSERKQSQGREYSEKAARIG